VDAASIWPVLTGSAGTISTPSSPESSASAAFACTSPSARPRRGRARRTPARLPVHPRPAAHACRRRQDLRHAGNRRGFQAPVHPARRADRLGAAVEKERGPLTRPSIRLPNDGVVEALPAAREPRRVAIPLRWLGDSRWSRGHASTRWHLRCQYCHKLPLDHLLSAVPLIIKHRPEVRRALCKNVAKVPEATRTRPHPSRPNPRGAAYRRPCAVRP